MSLHAISAGINKCNGSNYLCFSLLHCHLLLSFLVLNASLVIDHHNGEDDAYDEQTEYSQEIIRKREVSWKSTRLR